MFPRRHGGDGAALGLQYYRARAVVPRERGAAVLPVSAGMVPACQSSAARCWGSRAASFPLQPGDHFTQDVAATPANRYERHALGLEIINGAEAAG